MSEPTRSPLTWPHWFPRTPARERKDGRFKTKNSSGYSHKSLTLQQACGRVLAELSKFTRHGHTWRCNPDTVIISTDLQLRRDGLPRSGQRAPADPGAAVYFNLDGRDRCIPCDTYNRIEDNIAAIAATIEALRTIERHGSQMFEAAFVGFQGLPAPDQVVGRSWRDVLNYYGADLAEARQAYMRARKAAHEDHGGSSDQFHQVQTAWAQAQQELGP
ncbi:hypothetical protein SAMN05216421_1068 [Halopseudomonas xinjiangensis]|uniref:J domain-containing protein n=1 Tax=Halopseudomonas xinjiangensis TaxID=487184 RepID=A0A1H1Q6D0_9GAMM|nr:hypothetical protein [Halopseudomonas xinjiangensis]SDS18976.1 hypothetical protein SAMN05216421_1068 [Halopseudomonas xinjiangensis]